jgi:O-antigen ligase
MTILIILFLLSLVLGQTGAFTIVPGVRFYIHDVFLLIYLGARIITLDKRHIIRPTLTKPIVLFLLIGVLSLTANFYRINQEEFIQSSLYLVRWVAYVMLYVGLVQRKSNSRVWMWGLFAVGNAFSVLGLLQYIVYPDLRNLSYLGWDPHFYRLFSTLLDPNFTGIIIVLTLILYGYFLPNLAKPYQWLILLMNLTSLVLTYSRSSYVAAISALCIWFALSKKWNILLLIPLCVGIFLFVPKVPLDVSRLDRMESTIARITNWKTAVSFIKRSPIVGYGFNTLRFTRPDKTSSLADMVSHAQAGFDNSVLFLLATTGMVGLAAYGWILLAGLRLGLSLVKLNKNEKQFGILLIASLGSVLVHCMFTNSLFYPWVMIWLWIIVGISENMFRGNINK